MANTLDPDCYVVLPMFHAFNGCDTVSWISRRDLVAGTNEMHVWNAYDSVTPVFCALAATLKSIWTNWLGPLKCLVDL